MRISLLLEREPFAKILARTLEQYWQHQYGQSFQVEWRAKAERAGKTDSSQLDVESQHWICNSYLNSIFQSSIDPLAFDPIRREFSHSTVAWKRPLQKLYVSLATGPLASWLSHASLRVTPRLPDSQNLLIIPGNQKIRILNHDARESVCILKSGFKRDGFDTEIVARRLAEESQVVTPELLEVDLDAGWFREQYVSGTPLNRLNDPAAVEQALQKTVASLHLFVEPTLQSVPVLEYLDTLQAEIDGLLARCHRLNPHNRQSIQQGVHDLRKSVLQATRCSPEVSISQTHGDFQPANILVNDSDVWLIDWENSKVRQSGYDLLVFDTSSRMSVGLSRRMNELVKADDSLLKKQRWPGVTWGAESERIRHIELFMLEELAWHLKENTNEIFSKESDGLNQIVNELNQWLKAKT